MPAGPLTAVLEHLRHADGAPTDADLLGRYVAHRDAAALAALVRRHGPMVWGVCRRRLDHHDAEDAFQATFLVLVRKAGGVRPQDRLANWLRGVAHRAALLARRAAARRRAREARATVGEAIPPRPAADEQPVLEEELARLPDKYRAAVLLCDVQGRTRAEAARELGVPDGTVAGWLARGRAVLAKRLTRRGITLGVLTAASVPDAAVASAISAATSATAVSAGVATLTTQVIQAMTTSKFKLAAAVVVGVLALTTLAVGLAVGRPPAPEPVKAADDPAGWLVGTWTVKFENGVSEWCGVGKDRTAKVVDSHRRSPGKVEVRDGSVLVVYDDDRLERWTRTDERAVVEHWFPAAGYPNEKAVQGVAERTTEGEPPQLPPHVVEKPDMKGSVESSLPWKMDREPTEETIRVATKTFVSDLGSHPTHRLREFFDPRYLKKHGLTDKEIAFEVVGGYRGLHNYVVADDNRTILCTLERTADGKVVRELFLLRWVLHEGHLYVSPEKAPDEKTGIFTPWILRAKP